MKHLARLLSLLVLVVAGVFFTNCGGDDGGDKKSEQEIQYEKLKGVWVVESADLTGSAEDWTATFDGATLNLGAGTFQENGTYDFAFDVAEQVDYSPWPSAGEWKFGSTASSDIIRLDPDDEEVSMTYTVNGNSLEIEFLYTGAGFVNNARTESVEGAWTFTFTKQ